MSQAGQIVFLVTIESLTGNTGGYVEPNLGNINILGVGDVSVANPTPGDPSSGTLEISVSGAIPNTFTTNSGDAVPSGQVLNVLGGSNISTSGSGNTITIDLYDSITLPATTADTLKGVLNIGLGKPQLQAYGTDNIFLGGAGNFTMTTAVSNVAAGAGSAAGLTTGDNNCFYGVSSGASLASGSNNIILGTASGNAFTSSESSNICIGSAGVVATSNKIWIGDYGTGSAQQDTAYIAGVVHASNGLTADLGDITCTAGNITATVGYIKAADDSVYVNTTSLTTLANELAFQKSRSGATVVTGDFLGNIKFYGHDGTQHILGSVITSKTSGTIATDRVASDLEFWTHPDSTGISTRRLDIKPTGEVYIYAPDSGVGLTIAGRGETIDAGDLLLTDGNITTTDGDVNIGNIATGTTAPILQFNKSRASGAITSGDQLGGVLFTGDDGTSPVIAAGIGSVSSGTIATGRVAANLEFSTHPDSVTGATKRMEIKPTGEVVISAPDSGTALTVTGTTASTTFDTNVVAAGVTLSGTTLSADGTDTDISINITAKGTGQVIIDDLQLGTPLTVQYGGTGASSLTDHAVLVGSGTGAVTALSVGTNGQLLTGVTTADPTWTTASYPSTVNKGDVFVASANNVVDIVAGATTAGYVLMANGATNAPSFQANPGSTAIQTLAGDSGTASGTTVTIAGGSNLTTSATSATVTVDMDSSITLVGDVTALNLKTSTAATNLTLNGNTITSAGTAGADIDINLVAKGAGGLTFDGISTGYSDSQWHIRQSELQTTNAVATALVTIPLVEGEMITINATINGFQNDFTDACGATCVMSAYRPTGGNVTQIGEELININSTSTATISADVDVGTQSMVIYATGVTAETWNWVSTHQYMFTKTNA